MSSGLEQKQAPVPVSLPQVGSESHKGPCIPTPMHRAALGLVDILKELKSRRVSFNTSFIVQLLSRLATCLSPVPGAHRQNALGHPR
jgi:hypothetical protein